MDEEDKPHERHHDGSRHWHHEVDAPRARVGREEVPVDADGASDTAQEVLQGRDRGQPRDTHRQALQDRHGEEGPLHQVHNED